MLGSVFTECRMRPITLVEVDLVLAVLGGCDLLALTCPTAGWSAPSMTSPNCTAARKIVAHTLQRVAGTPPELRGRSALLAWLDLLRTEGFWLVDDDVFGCDEHVCALGGEGARRDGIDT